MTGEFDGVKQVIVFSQQTYYWCKKCYSRVYNFPLDRLAELVYTEQDENYEYELLLPHKKQGIHWCFQCDEIL